MNRPLAIDLYCGLGGWAEGLLAEGFQVIGFDIERHEYGEHRYPAQLVIQDVLTLHGSQFKDAALIVASPPCQAYSYMAMPWSRAKVIAADYRSGKRDVKQLTALFDACFRIQREACAAAERHIPLVVENVKGAQPWVGRARWAYGSFFLWGDVPALMPIVRKAAKVPGLNWSGSDRPGYVARAFNTTAEQRLADGQKNPGFRFDGSGRSFQSESVKNTGGSWFNIAHNTTIGKGRNPDGRKTVGHPNKRDGFDHMRHLTNPAEHEGQKHKDRDGYERSHPNAFGWKSPRTSSGNVTARKMASAMIAKIPLPLSRHIARCYRASPLSDAA